MQQAQVVQQQTQTQMCTQPPPTTFSRDLFGEDLARLLDALLRVQARDVEGFEQAPLPLLTPFAMPSGDSWYEADLLTRHYYTVAPISWQFAIQTDPDIAALFAARGVAPVLSPFDVRRTLHERWLEVTAPASGCDGRGSAPNN
jgi:hypothetical protein